MSPLNVCPQPESVFCSIDLEHLEYLANQKNVFDSNLRMTAKIRSVLRGRPAWFADPLPGIFSQPHEIAWPSFYSMIVIFLLETKKNKFMPPFPYYCIKYIRYLSTKRT